MKDSESQNYIDPLYEAPIFQKDFWDVESSANLDRVHEIITTHEFSRLNFVMQEGLAWLEFPPVSYTKYLAALGCWYLADWTTDNVLVKVHDRGMPLRERLERFGLLQEFRLALLFRDLGHFPFTFTIENNDILRHRYMKQEATRGIDLRHEDISISLICAGNYNWPGEQNKSSLIFELFREFTKKKMKGEPDPKKFISGFLRTFPKISVEKIVYLLDPTRPEPAGTSEEAKRFMRLVRHLVSGVISLNVLDRYNRVSHYIYGRQGELPIREFLRCLVLVEDEEQLHIRVCDEGKSKDGNKGIDHAIHIISDVKTKLVKNILNDHNRLALKVMLSDAINRHWMCAEDNFRTYLPFMEDNELSHHLMISKDPDVKETMRRIHIRRPFVCVGHFCMADKAAYENLCSDETQLKDLQEQRRQKILSHFGAQQQLEKQNIFIRLAKNFGKPDKKEIDAVPGNSDAMPEWLDMDKITVDDEDGVKKLSEATKYKEVIDNIRKHDACEKRSFWLFIKEEDQALQNKALYLARDIGATKL